MAHRSAARDVALVVYDGIQSLDLTGPLEVLHRANELLAERGDDRPYRLHVVAADAEPVTSTSGLGIVPDGALGDLPDVLDTVIVVGGVGTRAAMADDHLLDWVRRVRTRRLASVCSGAFVLAAAGLLDGRSATTHWSVCDTLAELYPEIDVQPDPIYVRDGPIATSAGVTAGMDLALAFVDEDLGPEVALEVARYLVLFARRPGGQAQFSAQLAAQSAPTGDALRGVLAWAVDHPDADLSVAALARRAHLSPRHFARVFRDDVGQTPAAYVERLRVEASRRLLETTDLGIDEVARRSGFAVTETMRRAFRRTVGVTPSAYRERFSATSPSPQPTPQGAQP